MLKAFLIGHTYDQGFHIMVKWWYFSFSFILIPFGSVSPASVLRAILNEKGEERKITPLCHCVLGEGSLSLLCMYYL